MQVEIWSDIMCPFCYIGKRKFEAGLEQFAGKDNVEVIWRSFQLNPELKAAPGQDIYTYLAEAKGMSLEQSKQMHSQVADMAKQAGLDYDLDKAVIANTYNAHRLIQLAKAHGLGDAMEERLFKAYFTEGYNLDDMDTLTQLGLEVGIDAALIAAALNSDAFGDAVDADIAEAQAIGVRGVPFFVIDRKYAVSGAQAPETFLGALEQAWKEQSVLVIADGDSCDTDGNCD